jgi:MraZ protein
MFIGKHQVKLDPKGRISVPAKFRESLSIRGSNQLVITLWGRCLVAYPMDEWQEVERRARELDTSQEDVRNFLRIFYANAADCQVDGQGRILIPEHLRTDAGLEKEVLMSGIGVKFEIWNRDRWEQEVQPTQDRMVEVAASAGIVF